MSLALKGDLKICQKIFGHFRSAAKRKSYTFNSNPPTKNTDPDSQVNTAENGLSFQPIPILLEKGIQTTLSLFQ
jgi:hypothetical protein